MPSPFPGMDPYLEKHWGDIHHRLVTYACDQLRPQLPEDLRARIEERVFVESDEDEDRPLVPDLRIVARKRRRDALRAEPPVAVLTPSERLVVKLADPPPPQGYVEIRESAGGKLITVIEVLSLSNKMPGLGRGKYLQKREELLNAAVSLVEIDLLRSGQRLLPLAQESLPAKYRTPYQMWVWRGWKPDHAEIYRASLRERLPVIAVPLRKKDADVALDLQALLAQCYENGDYEGDLDYQQPPDLALEPADARWASAMLQKAGLRKGRKKS